MDLQGTKLGIYMNLEIAKIAGFGVRVTKVLLVTETQMNTQNVSNETPKILQQTICKLGKYLGHQRSKGHDFHRMQS